MTYHKLRVLLTTYLVTAGFLLLFVFGWMIAGSTWDWIVDIHWNLIHFFFLWGTFAGACCWYYIHGTLFLL